MTVTEEEAKKKICRRFPVCVEERRYAKNAKRFYDFMPSFCIASACMMWVWDTAEETKGYCGSVRRMSSKEVIYHGHDRRGNLQIQGNKR